MLPSNDQHAACKAMSLTSVVLIIMMVVTMVTPLPVIFLMTIILITSIVTSVIVTLVIIFSTPLSIDICWSRWRVDVSWLFINGCTKREINTHVWPIIIRLRNTWQR